MHSTVHEHAATMPNATSKQEVLILIEKGCWSVIIK